MADSPDEFHCLVCRDAGWLRRDLPLEHPDFGKAQICEACANQPKPIGIPDRLLNKRFKTFDLALNRTMKPAYERCKRVASGDEWACVMVGGPGLGKSHLAAAALYEHPLAGHFWEVGHLLRTLRAEAFADGGPKTPEHEVLWRWQDYRPLLVLDDLGAEKWTDWAVGTLYSLLNYRYQRSLPTVITTNVAESLDDRLLSRFAEGAVVCTGVDVRRTKR